MNDIPNAVDAAHGGQMQPPLRRPYKRISPTQWEDQKEHIRTLYIEQDRSMAEVVALMKTSHDFEAG